MSGSTLQRTFRTLAGTSVAQHILARRLEAACRLLAGGAPVADAARRSGFADPAYFARIFRRRQGATPTAFRARAAASCGARLH
jgi:AraC-like DNA-binding protein